MVQMKKIWEIFIDKSYSWKAKRVEIKNFQEIEKSVNQYFEGKNYDLDGSCGNSIVSYIG